MKEQLKCKGEKFFYFRSPNLIHLNKYIYFECIDVCVCV